MTKPHPHIHVIVNSVSPADRRLSSTSQEKLKLSRWAEDWEQRHGKIYCEQRVANNVERDQGRFVKNRSGVSRSTFEATKSVMQGLNDNREAQQAAAELKADQRRKAAELAAIGRDMYEHYRTELTNSGANYQRDKTQLIAAHLAERDALQTEIRRAMKEAMRNLVDAQCQEQRTIAWREKSLLGRLWNAYDVGRSADHTRGRIERTPWAAVSRSARVDHMRQSQSEQRQAHDQDLKHWADNRNAELRQRQVQDLTAAYEKFQASRDATLSQYDQEQQGYRRLWAERNEARRDAWRAFEARYQPADRKQLRHQRQQENLRRIEGRAQRFMNRAPRDRDNELER